MTEMRNWPPFSLTKYSALESSITPYSSSLTIVTTALSVAPMITPTGSNKFASNNSSTSTSSSLTNGTVMVWSPTSPSSHESVPDTAV